MRKQFFSLLAIAMIFNILQAQELTLNDIWKSRKFLPKGVYGIQSMKDGEYYTVLEKDSINMYEYKTGDYVRTIAAGPQMIPEGDTTPIRISRYEFSQDETKLLLPTRTKSIYRYSSESFYYIWDIPSQTLSALSSGGKQRLADFSPDGTKVAFVRDNNLFVKDLERNIEYQVTQDGEHNKIIYGTTDWVYEEEFAITKGFQWSPDSKKIAFYRFDESEVKEWWLTQWGDLYPEHYKFKYPKAGEDNSLVSVHVYDVGNQLITDMDTGQETDQYLPRFYWTKTPGKLAIFRVNRLQNHFEILLNDAESGSSEIIYSEKSHTYIEESHYDHVIFVDQNRFILTSEKDDYYHIYLNYIDGTPEEQLTSGNWDVSSIIGYDEANEIVYFTAAQFVPYNREVYSVSLKGKMKQVSRDEGWNDPDFSTNYEYYINTWSDANTPPVYTLNNTKGKAIRTLEENTALKDTVDAYHFSPKEFFSFTTSEGVELYGWQILPPDFDPAKKYPVFMYVYGGPGAQTVTNNWGYFNLVWFQMLAQKGYIIISVDNRGTGARGQEFKKVTYMELGKYETIDQIEAAKYMASKPYVDPDRIGIFGWSYGGYMSTLCITKGADVFSTAIAVAPVTNWRYYDNIYTERFMRKPQQNESGYDDNSPINHVEKLKGNYLLVHGTGDDNVHVQNSMDLITALVNANKQFDLFLYPNKNHGIYGGNTRIHLYTKMTDFILENL